MRTALDLPALDTAVDKVFAYKKPLGNALHVGRFKNGKDCLKDALAYIEARE